MSARTVSEVTAADLYHHRVVSQVHGCAGHPWAVFSVKRANRADDAYRTTLWLRSRDGHVLAVGSKLKPSSARMSPGGDRVAFLSLQKKGAMQPMLLMTSDLGTRTVGEATSEWQGIEQWSPDGTRLLMLRKIAWKEDALDNPGAGENRPRVVRHLPYKQDGGGIRAGYRTQLVELNLATGHQRTLVQGDFDVQHAAWSPDGDRLAFIRTRTAQQRHRSDLWLADAEGGNAERVTDSLAGVNQMAWSPDSTRIALNASEIEGDSIAGLYVVQPGGAGPRRATAAELHVESAAPVWHEDSRRVAVVAATRGLFEIAVVDTADGSVHQFAHGLRQVSALCASDGGLLHIAATMRTLCELYRADWDGSAPQRVSRFNRAWFATRLRPRVAKRVFRVPDGRGGSERAEAWVLTPPDRDPPYPVYVDMHGGPQSVALIDFANHLYWYALVARGWMVVAPNAVGSNSYGDAFARRLRGHWGELDLPQYLTILGTLRQRGEAGAQAGCGGKSYGGFLSAWAAGHCDAFDKIVISAPVADLESHFGTSDSGYYVSAYAMDGEIEAHRDRYHRLSPVQRIASTAAPILLLQGQDDQRCPLDQSEELFAALVRANLPAMMVVYPGGSHSLAATGKPSHREDYHQRFTAWISGSDAAAGKASRRATERVPRSNSLETGSLERQVGGTENSSGV